MNGYVESTVEKLQEKIKECIKTKRINDALILINLCADILYNYNQNFVDDFLEKTIHKISEEILGSSQSIEVEHNKVVFYDGFGFDRRGLAQIYIKALSRRYKVIYITHIDNKGSIPEIESILRNSGSEIFWVNEKKNLESIYELENIIVSQKPKHLLIYDYPDNAATSILAIHFKNNILSYKINLTDHAYWLGASAFDYYIEFRNIGAYISNKYRKIEKEKLIKLPFYPIIDFNQKFEGFPSGMECDGKKIVFSGGSLYKTLSRDGKYYNIVRNILNNHNDVIFWYAGSGDATEINKLILEYPQRVFFTKERKDLYQILEKCCFYLSTYPLAGGLMYQYAAMAGKLPLTLKHNDMNGECLINQENLGIDFETYDELICEINNVLICENYRANKELKIKENVIGEDDFEKELYNAVENHRTRYTIENISIDLEKFLREYSDNMTLKKLCLIIKSSRKFIVFSAFPDLFIKGKLYSLRDKFYRIFEWKKEI